MLQLKVNGNKYEFTRENGEVVEFNPIEINFITRQLERNKWLENIEFYIDSYKENFDFTEISREEFIDQCMDTLEDRWVSDTIGDNIDYQELVVDEASNAEIWRDEE